MNVKQQQDKIRDLLAESRYNHARAIRGPRFYPLEWEDMDEANKEWWRILADPDLKMLSENGVVLYQGFNAVKLVEDFQREHRCLEHPHDAWDAANIAGLFVNRTLTAPLTPE